MRETQFRHAFFSEMIQTQSQEQVETKLDALLREYQEVMGVGRAEWIKIIQAVSNSTGSK